MTPQIEVLKRHYTDEHSPSVSLVRYFGTTYEVSWFMSPEDAGMHTTHSEAEAEEVYAQKVAQIQESL